MNTGTLVKADEAPAFPFLIETEQGWKVKAYCLIIVEAGRHDDVVAELKARELPQIEAVHKVAGTYDVVAELIGDDPRAIGESIINVIQRIDGVVSTVTLLAFC